MFHLGWFVSKGFGPKAWKHDWAGSAVSRFTKPDMIVDLAVAMERSGFDYIMLEDSSNVPYTYQGSHDAYLRYSVDVPKLDPSVLAPFLVAATKHLGVVVTCSTTEYHPFMLARKMNALDHVSDGRIGWNVVTGSNDGGAQNYGRDKQYPHDQRYDMADEFLELTHKLWDAWDPDAVVLDLENGIFADGSKVHPVEFEGKWFRSRGPLNAPRSPQGSPVICQAGGSGRGRQFAATWAETIIAQVSTPEKMKAFRDDVRARAVAIGRDPDTVKVLFLASPILGDTRGQARERLAAARELSEWGMEYQRASLSRAAAGHHLQRPPALHVGTRGTGPPGRAGGPDALRVRPFRGHPRRRGRGHGRGDAGGGRRRLPHGELLLQPPLRHGGVRRSRPRTAEARVDPDLLRARDVPRQPDGVLRRAPVHTIVMLPLDATGTEALPRTLEVVRALEGGGIDAVALLPGSGRPALEPVTAAAALVRLTSRIGVLAADPVGAGFPYNTARRLASLDHVGAGRTGWFAVGSGGAQDAGFVNVVGDLWRTWEPGAERPDKLTGNFHDDSRIHRIDPVDQRYRVRGPLDTPPTPWGPPVVVVDGRDRVPDWASSADLVVVDDVPSNAEELEHVECSADAVAEASRRRSPGVAVDGRLDLAWASTFADDIRAHTAHASAPLRRRLSREPEVAA
jgi:FMN-dependent oxidoreductase (nitrilotriacetate monooxygenase family)